MLKVGSIEKTDNGYLIYREYFGQGMIFKDEDAYLHRKNQPCYVAELSDKVYTGQDILDMCNDQQEFADQLFYALDWQHPETLKDEMLSNEEWLICESCGALVNYECGNNQAKCLSCGTTISL